MKALLLSAGLGERLRPMTNNLPKVMVPLNDKPGIEYHIKNLKKQGIEEFAVNTHYLPEKIRQYLGDGSKFGTKIVYSFEPELLGTAGALNNFRDFFDDTFLVVYADVFANFNVFNLEGIHRKNKAIATILLDDKRPFQGKGVVQFKGEKVTNFIEKPEKNLENSMINSGFYILEPEVMKYISRGFSDFGREILPKLAKEGFVFCGKHTGYIFDIGTLKDLKKAEDYSKNLAAEGKS